MDIVAMGKDDVVVVVVIVLVVVVVIIIISVVIVEFCLYKAHVSNYIQKVIV